MRKFQPGDQVMVLVPTSECKFLAKWHGPYEVVERVRAGELQGKATRTAPGHTSVPH